MLVMTSVTIGGHKWVVGHRLRAIQYDNVKIVLHNVFIESGLISFDTKSRMINCQAILHTSSNTFQQQK